MKICKHCGFVSSFSTCSFETKGFDKLYSKHSSLYGSRLVRKRPFGFVFYSGTHLNTLSCTIESLKRNPVSSVKYNPVVEDFQSAMIKLFRESKVEPLEQLLAGDCVWKNCINTVTGKQQIIEALRGLASFLVEPAIYIAKSSDERVEFSEPPSRKVFLQWTVSAVWPIFWKPVVTYSGSSVITLNEQGLVSSIEDFPSCSPWKILWDLLYSIRYVYFAVVADPPEEVCNGRKLIRWTRKYTLWEEVAHVRWEYTSNQVESMEGIFSCLPVLPSEIFTDNFTRNETIFWTSPLFFRIDLNAPPEQMTWSFPYPVRFTSHSTAQLGVTRRQISGGRRVASKMWFGDVRREQLYSIVEGFVNCLKTDGLLSASHSINSLDIWWESWDCYLGFNRFGQLTLAMYRNGLVRTSFITCYLPPE